MRDCFVPKNYSYANLAKIRRANALIEEYEAMGLKFTARQMYYAFVSDNVIENTFREYKNFCELLKDARLSGHIDWDGIEDRTRELEEYTMWDSPQASLENTIRNYIEDAWADQPAYVEVWIEKSALMGVLYKPCWEYRLPFMSCRGYSSVSQIYVAAQRFKAKMEEGKKGIILHLGDHDPSGVDMSRDNTVRLDLLSDDCGIELRRIALNPDQIDQYKLPSQPAKKEDVRLRGYAEAHGHKLAWELDALKPDILMEIVSTAVKPIIDWEKWDAHMEREQQSRDYIKRTWQTGREWAPFKGWVDGLQS